MMTMFDIHNLKIIQNNPKDLSFTLKPKARLEFFVCSKAVCLGRWPRNHLPALDLGSRHARILNNCVFIGFAVLGVFEVFSKV